MPLACPYQTLNILLYNKIPIIVAVWHNSKHVEKDLHNRVQKSQKYTQSHLLIQCVITAESQIIEKEMDFKANHLGIT